jgi:hypothetical protein
MPAYYAAFREYVPETDYVVHLDEHGAVKLVLNVQRDGEQINIGKPEQWDSIVETVTRLRRAQEAAAAILAPAPSQEETE